MNVVEAFFVTLGLDHKQFGQGAKAVDADLKKLREKSAKTAQEISDQGKKAAEFYRSVKIELLGLLAVFGAATGLKDFITTSITGQAALGRLSRNLDMSASRLEAWSVIAEETGAQGSDALGALQTVAAGLAEAAVKGHSALTDTARANQVALTDAKGHALDYEHVLLNISKRMRELPRQQALWLANQLGVGSMFNTLELGPDELEKRLAMAQRLSRVTGDSAAKAEALQKQWADLKERFKGVSDDVFAKLEPVLIRLGNELATFIDQFDWDKVVNEAGEWLDDLKQVVDALGGVKGVLIEIAAIKMFSFMVGFAGNIAKLIQLTRVLRGVEAAAGEAAAAEGAAAAGGAAAGVARKGLLGMMFGAGRAVLLNPYVDAFLALVYSKGLGGQQRADGTYEDEALSAAQLDAAAKDPRIAAWLRQQRNQTLGIKPTRVRADDDIDLFKATRPTGNTQKLFSSLEQQYGLPKGLLNGVFQAESRGGDPNYMVSPKGALGPFQFMPDTAKEYGLQDPFNMDQSADAAARKLRHLIQFFHGDVAEAVAAYNYGEGNVQSHGMGHLPAETQDYLRRVLSNIQLGAASVAGAPLASAGRGSSEIFIGRVDINTRATDGRGIMRDLKGSIARNSLIAQADTGLV